MADNIQIDVRDLACPEPIVKVKKILKNIDEKTLKERNCEIIGNTISAKENISRFLQNNGYEFNIGHVANSQQYMILVTNKRKSVKGKQSEKIIQKILFIKSNRIGEGELGVMLINSFIKNLINTNTLPERIIFVNSGVLLTTDNQEVNNEEIVETLKELEKLGVKIYSCSSCLSYYVLTERLKVGMIGNALEILENMLDSDGVISF